MKYYVSRHEILEIVRGKEFAGLFHKEPSEKAKYPVDISRIVSCHACSAEFVLQEHNEHHSGDFCDHCVKIHAD